MSGTGSDVAIRDAAALAIQPGQTSFDGLQLAALRQIGLEDAAEGERSLFLHMSQRTGLDPFSGQIRMIPRREKVRDGNGREVWRTKYSVQTGIDGLRVMRARAEHAAGVRGVLSRPVYYDAEGKEYKVWFQRMPPVAVEMTYTVRDATGETPYTSILRFTEYAQTRKDDNGNVVLSGQWAVKGVHMLEKCTEADVYRKAFPQDFSGIVLDDAMPAPDPDAPPVQPERPRVTADQARQRAPQHVQAEVVTESPSPAAPENPSSAPAAAPPAETAAAGEASPELESARRAAHAQARRVFGDDRGARLLWAARIITADDGDVKSFDHLTLRELHMVVGALAKVDNAAELAELLKSGEVPGE